MLVIPVDKTKLERFYFRIFLLYTLDYLFKENNMALPDFKGRKTSDHWGRKARF